jgi:1,4-dihydroxy-2-naphthoate octaprenyltransferase
MAQDAVNAKKGLTPQYWLPSLYTMPKFREDAPPDSITRWLIASRAAVVIMSLISGLLGGLLVLVGAPEQFSLGLTLLTALGLVLAHAGSNLVNDYWDARHGIDSPDSPRVNYGPQAFVNGEFTKKQLLLGTGIILAIAAAIGLYLAYVAGPMVFVFMGLGAAILMFYSGDPFPLKYRGFGELAVLLVWGPLMVGGAYYIQTQTLPWWVLAASLPYALGVTTVLFGKHLDKVDFDAKNKTNTLVVLLGEKNARATTRGLVALMYILPVALVVTGIFSPTVLLVAFALPLAVWLWKIFDAPKPKAPPEWAIGWPLYFVGVAFIHNRRFGMLYLLGIILDIAVSAWFPGLRLPKLF